MELQSKELDEDRGYKYLGIQQSDGIKVEEVTEIVKREYFRRIRLILNLI